MDHRQLISSFSPWETTIGYSRAIRVGNLIEVSGTTAMDGDTIIGKGNVDEQTIFIFKKIEKALHEAGATINDVIRTRMYVTNIAEWELIGKAHGEFFNTIKPAATMVEIKSLIHPDLMIEREVTALNGN